MRIKQIVKKTLAITLVMALLCSMSTMLFSMTASADVVSHVVSDDFEEGSSVTVDGAAANRADTWGLYDYAGVLAGTATEATEITEGIDFSTTPQEVVSSVANNTTGILGMPLTSNATLTYKGWNHETDKIKTLSANFIRFTTASYNASEGITLYANPHTGASITLWLRSQNATTFIWQITTTSKNPDTGASLLSTPVNNVINPTLGNHSAYPNVTTAFNVAYSYDDQGRLTTIAINAKFYTDPTLETYYPGKSTAGLNYSITFDHSGDTVAIYKTGTKTDTAKYYSQYVTYTDDFIAGFRAPSNKTYKNGFDNLSMTFDREVVVDYAALAAQFQADHAGALALEASDVDVTDAAIIAAAKEAYDALSDGTKELLPGVDTKLATLINALGAAQFKDTYKDVLALETSDIDAGNAPSVVTAKTAYDALDDAVKAVIPEVGTKLAALLEAAIPNIPTDSQKAFEDYYAANIEGKTTAVGSEVEFETAMNLYDAVEDTHKANVAAKYEALCDVAVDSFIDGNNVNHPALSLEKLNALVKANINTGTYVSKMTVKIDAYAYFANYTNNNAGTFYVHPYMLTDAAGQGIELSHQNGKVGGDANNLVRAIRIRQHSPGALPTNLNNFNADTSALGYSTGYGTMCGNAANITATEAAKWSALHTDNPATEAANDPILTADNRYLTLLITTSYDNTWVTFNETHNSYVVQFRTNYKFFYDADNDGVYTPDTADILLNGSGTGNDNNFFYKTDATTNYVTPVGYNIPVNTYSSLLVAGYDVELTEAAAPSAGELFVEKYGNLFASNTPAPDAALPMYFDYVDESNDLKAEIKDEVNAVLVKAGVLPTTAGATIRTDLDQNMGFYTQKPAKTSQSGKYRIKEMGSVIAGADYIAENGLELVKGEEGTVFGSITYEPEDNVDGSILAVLHDTNISAKDMWSIRIASRSFVVWTDTETGAEVILYSANDDANNTNIYDDDFDTTGACIRSVNQIIRTIAGAVYNADESIYADNLGVETKFGAEYKDANYADVKAGLSADGVILTEDTRDAEATLKMLIAFKKLVAKVANS